MIAIPIVIAALTIGGIFLFVAVRTSAWNAQQAGTGWVTPNVGWRYADKGIELPGEKIYAACRAIDDVLTKHFPSWEKKSKLVVELHRYGAVIRGPFISTGFVTAGNFTHAAAPPEMTPTPEYIEKTMRVVGTIRPEPRWPWHRKQWAVLIADGRVGATHAEVLLGQGSEKPRADIGSTALWYEVAWRFVPLALEGKTASGLVADPNTALYRMLITEMKSRYAELSKV